MWTYRAIIVRWKDGDTLVAHIDQGFHDWKHNQALRLVGIDAPDAQPAKDAARAYCEKTWPPGTEIIVRTVRDERGNETQSFERWLAAAWYNGVQLSTAICNAGHAKVYKPR